MVYVPTVSIRMYVRLCIFNLPTYICGDCTFACITTYCCDPRKVHVSVCIFSQTYLHYSVWLCIIVDHVYTHGGEPYFSIYRMKTLSRQVVTLEGRENMDPLSCKLVCCYQNRLFFFN